MDQDKSSILMEVIMSEDLEGTKNTDMEFLPTQMAPATREHGEKDKDMEKGY
jgi:hypothetical protein